MLELKGRFICIVKDHKNGRILAVPEYPMDTNDRIIERYRMAIANFDLPMDKTDHEDYELIKTILIE